MVQLQAASIRANWSSGTYAWLQLERLNTGVPGPTTSPGLVKLRSTLPEPTVGMKMLDSVRRSRKHLSQPDYPRSASG